MAAKRYTEAQYNAMDNATLVKTIDAMSKSEASSYLPPKVKVRYFVTKYGDGLTTAIKGTGILFSVAVAMNMLESTFGKDPLAQFHNNFGGIKAVAGYPKVLVDTTEVIGGKTKKMKDYFASFPSAEKSFEHYVNIVKKLVPKIATLATAEEQVTAIAKAGYTTTPAITYLWAIQGNINRVRDMYGIGKIS